MRGTEHFKRHLSVVTWRQDNGGPVEKVSEIEVEDPFHRTKVVLQWTVLEWLRMLFTRREVEVVVHVRSDGVSQGRWFQGADICEKCKRARIGDPRDPAGHDPGYHHGAERWCQDCYYAVPITDGKPLTLTEAVEEARGGPAPTPRQGFA
jgi:hypothetical protein